MLTPGVYLGARGFTIDPNNLQCDTLKGFRILWGVVWEVCRRDMGLFSFLDPWLCQGQPLSWAEREPLVFILELIYTPTVLGFLPVGTLRVECCIHPTNVNHKL